MEKESNIHQQWLAKGRELATSIDGLDVDEELAKQIAIALMLAYREGRSDGTKEGYDWAEADAQDAARGVRP